jgi:2-octaprenyl-6-methoxyphenol hydroxylase
MARDADIVVAGGGVAGLALALAVRLGSASTLDVLVCDPAIGKAPGGDLRASAISAGASRMLAILGVWDDVLPEAQPILDMILTDTSLDEPVRPVILRFDGDVAPGEPFAHMVPNGVLFSALKARAAAAGVRLSPVGIERYEASDDHVTVLATDGARYEATLLVAADGARSRLREQAGIPLHGWTYAQSAIVTTVEHEHPHHGRAVEHFLPSGPLALLPLKGNRASIVWTERKEDAQRLVAQDREAFDRALQRRLGHEFGTIRSLDRPAVYPLSLGIARDFVARRLALVGDAAHVIHPIAGQGLNLGLKDAAALAEAIVDDSRLGLDIGAAGTLETYQRARRFDAASMAVTTDVLNRLFSNDVGPLRMLRDIGLGLVERVPAAKRFFIRQAGGVGTLMPRLMRGDTL